ncbi:MAG: hypothetical protein ACOCRX_01525 [Candidatus Woesearchaeota archaeon]
METIAFAAIKIKDGTILKGKSHSEIINNAEWGTCKGSKIIQGFLTSKNRFVNREKAALIAFESQQIQKKVRILFSEDLWVKNNYKYHKDIGYYK